MSQEDPEDAIAGYMRARPAGRTEADDKADRAHLERIFVATREIVLRYAREDPPARRAQHAKHTAGLWAYLVVSPNIPPKLRRGIFALPGARHRAWVRFSNSSPRVQADSLRDGRAIAIKVLGVQGDRAAPPGLTLQSDTQDFILLNNDRFFVHDVEEMTEVFEWLAEGHALPLYYFWKGKWGRLRILLKHGVRPNSPLELTYHSQVPFALGDAEVKYRLKPLSGVEPGRPSKAERESGYHLRYVLRRQLDPKGLGAERAQADDVGAVVFSLQVVQRRVRDELDHPDIGWSSNDEDFIEVARLRIPRQDFNHPQRMSFAERMSFSVWNAHAEQRPLGMLNWARASAYAFIRDLRHRENGSQEPTYSASEWDELLSLPATPLPPLNELREVLHGLNPGWRGALASLLRSPYMPVLPALVLLCILWVILLWPGVVGGPLPTEAILAAVGANYPSERLIPPARYSEQYKEKLARMPKGYSPEEDVTWLFRFGSMGTEFDAGIPYWIYRVLPRIAPSYFDHRPDWSSVGLTTEETDDHEYYVSYHDLPRGLILTDTVIRIGNNDVPFPLKRVTLNCASCHRGEYQDARGKRHFIDGMPNLAFDAAAYKRQSTAAIASEDFTVERVLAAIDEELEKEHKAQKRAGDPPRLTAWERLGYTEIVQYMRKGALEKELLLKWIDNRPPNGPGRLDAFGALRFEVFRMTDKPPPVTGYTEELIATVDLPSIWNQGTKARPMHHYDGNTRDSAARNVGAIIGVGGSPLSVRPGNVERIGRWIDDELGAPPIPFGCPDQARARRGKQIYDDKCQNCHGVYDQAGKLSQASDCMQLTERGLADTDPARWKAIDAAFIDKLNELGERNGLWQRGAFSVSGGYLCPPLDGIWARAPYLHNGSVPTLDDLLKDALRPETFVRGNPMYDVEKGGFRSDQPGLKRVSFPFDTKYAGNHNHGHASEFQLERDPVKRRDLIEYLYSLPTDPKCLAGGLP